MLSDSESDVGSQELKLTINEHFAKAYAAKKEREELSKRLFYDHCRLAVILIELCFSKRQVWL